MSCKYFTYKSKKGIKYRYCRLHRKNIDSCYVCEDKEYKVYKQLKATSKNKHKLTKGTEIPLRVKKTVWERDNHECIFCHKKVEMFNANSHYIKRSHLGLGIEQNIFTACFECHQKYDDSINRTEMMKYAKCYLKSKYNDWKEEDLIYRRKI